ncbi:hypothetical protein JCM10213v2_008149 [Rhodosporidiobolus nylandii]
MVSLATPLAGENPYSSYLATLEGQKPAPPDPEGLRIRLCVLFAFCAYVFVASIVNCAVHLYSNRLKGRSFWVFRLVRRAGGFHVVSNHFVLSGLTGICSVPLLIGNAAAIWRAFLGDGEGIETMSVCQASILPTAYALGWLLSFATFQSFLQVEGGRHNSRWTMPAWLENFAFLGGLFLSVAALTALAALEGLANRDQWKTFDSFRDYLSNSVASWNGTALSSGDIEYIASRFGEVSASTEKFYAVRKQVSLQLSKFTTVLNGESHAHSNTPPSHAKGIGAHSASPTSTHDASPQKPPFRDADPDWKKPTFPPYSSFDHIPTFIPLQNLRRSSFSKSPAPEQALEVIHSPTSMPSIHFVEDPNAQRARPTRSKIRALSQNPDRLASDQARRLMGMMQAEQELLVMVVSIFFIAISLVVWCSVSVPYLRSHDTNSWAVQEMLYTTPIWFFSVGLAFAETLHAWVEWRHLRPWRSSTRSTRSGSQSQSGSRSGNTNIPDLGIATAVRVDVQVVTRQEVVELEDFEHDVGVATDGVEKGRPASYDEENNTWTARGMGKPSPQDVWRD